MQNTDAHSWLQCKEQPCYRAGQTPNEKGVSGNANRAEENNSSKFDKYDKKYRNFIRDQ